MAREERVEYQCDICGTKAKASRFPQQPTGKGWTYVRPDGWGSAYMQVQEIGTQKVSRKVDFCSEECLAEFFKDFCDLAYGD